MKDIYAFFTACFVFFACVILLAVVGPYPLNSWEAHKVGVWLSSVEVPRDSHILRYETSVANFAGTGNQCDFAAGEIRTTSLTRRALLAFYKKRIDESNTLVSKRTFNVLFPDDEDSYLYLDETFTKLLKEYVSASTTDTTYLAIAIDGPHESGLDFRCH